MKTIKASELHERDYANDAAYRKAYDEIDPTKLIEEMREFDATVVERAKADISFQRELVKEAIELLAEDDIQAAMVLLNDLLAVYDA